MHLNCLKTTQQSDKFYLRQFQLQCLGQFSYYLESNNEALIIDPLRDIDKYLDELSERKAQLKYVLLTHLHADFVAGHLDLAKRTGAEVILGENAQAQYQFRMIKDGESLTLGTIKLRALHTPGHTLESTSFVLVADDRDYCVFSGDTLFIQEVGRPDLASKNSNVTKEQLAGLLYRSLRTKIMTLSDDVILYPGHGAGSACGKSIGAGTHCTIGTQKKSNYALQPMSEEEFINLVVDLPKPPQYFFHDVSVNRSGPNSLESLRKEVVRALNYEEFKHFVLSGYTIIDSREDISQGLIKDAINISFVANFATFVGTVIKPDTKLVVVADEGREELTIDRLLRIGYENVKGYLQGGFKNYGGEVVKAQIVSVEDFVKVEEQDKCVFIDCRSHGEVRTSGTLKGCMVAPLPDYERYEFPRDKTLRIFCRSGARAKVLMTLLMRQGYQDFVILQNAGFEHLSKLNVETEQIA